MVASLARRNSGGEPVWFTGLGPRGAGISEMAYCCLRSLSQRLLGGQCLSLADYVTLTAPTGEAVAAGCGG